MIKLCFLYFVWKSVEVRYWISLISRTEKNSNRVSWKLIRIPQTYNWIIFFRCPLSTATLKRPTTAPIRSYFEGSEDGSTRKHPTPYIWYIYVSGPAELRDRGAEGLTLFLYKSASPPLRSDPTSKVQRTVQRESIPHAYVATPGTSLFLSCRP